MRFRGAFHAHSTFSYDGRDPLDRLSERLRARGFQFLLLTEHDDKLGPKEYARVVTEARRLSGPEFLVVPGLEVRCWRGEEEQWHIGAAGVREWIPRGPIREVAGAIQRAGGLAILLHPYKQATAIVPGELDCFDGLEVWNGKFDGFYAPQGRTLRLFRELRKCKALPRFYCGHDLHGADEIAPLALEVEAEALECGALLDSLRRGAFLAKGNGLAFSSQAGPSRAQELYLRALRAGYESYCWLRGVPLLGALLGAGSAAQGSGSRDSGRASR